MTPRTCPACGGLNCNIDIPEMTAGGAAAAAASPTTAVVDDADGTNGR